MKKKITIIFLIAFLLVGCKSKLTFNSSGNDRYIYDDSIVYLDDQELKDFKLVDNNYETHLPIKEDSIVKVHNDSKFNRIYIVYELSGYEGNLSYNGKNKEIGKDNIMHEYIELDEETNDITLDYKDDAIITDIYVFSKKEEIPWWVQRWEKECDKADLLLIPAHADDEHLFFAGLIPTYVARGYKVQIAYLTYHADNPLRYHELLDGLWNAGVTNYPVIGGIPDAYSKSLDWALENLEKDSLTEDDVIKYQVSLIRRFHPDVVVTHAENGEYGHGQHILSNYILKKALPISDMATKFKDLDGKTWKPKKVYFHSADGTGLYLDIDKPLDYFDGKTAFNVSQDSFRFHSTQLHSGWLYGWIYGDDDSIHSSKQITKYSPNYYTLYYSSVGEDKNNNDLFENIK